MVDFNKIRRIQFGSHLLMYGVVAVSVHHLEDTPEVSVMAIPEGYEGDSRDYPISEEQYQNLTQSLIAILHKGQTSNSDFEDEGCLTCNAFIEDYDENTEDYASSDNLLTETYRELCETVNKVVQCPTITDLLDWI